jgi:protein SCO1/2
MIATHTPKALMSALALFLMRAVSCGTEETTLEPTTAVEVGFRGTERTDDFTPTDFSLIDQNRDKFNLSEQRGDLVMLFFGYTHCPDFRPFTLSTWQQVTEKLGGQADEVQFVYVTLNPKRYTPETIQRHLTHYDPSFVGLTGDEDYLETI